MLVVVPIPVRAFPDEMAVAQLLRLLLEGTIAVNRVLIRQHALPPIYASGVRYMPDVRPPFEVFAHGAHVLKRGGGDCDQLAAWRVAELREKGEEKAGVKIYPSQNGVLHAEVRRADGRVEDPSREFGMQVRRSNTWHY